MLRGLKYLAIVAASGMILGLAGAAFLESQFFKNWLRDLAVAVGQDYVRGELSLGGLEGNLFRRLELKQLLIKSQGDTALFIPQIAITFSPRELWRKQVQLDSIRIDSLFAALRQLPDSSWNFAHLFITDTTALHWELRSPATVLHHGRLLIRPLTGSPILPESVDDISASLAWSYADSAKTLHLQQLQLRTRAPEFILRDLAFRLTRRDHELELHDLVVTTAQNRLAGNAILSSTGVPKANARLTSAPVSFDEFRIALPALRIYGNPDFDLRTRLRDDSLYFHLHVHEQQQQLSLQGYLAHWNEVPHYSVNAALQNFDASTWRQDPQLVSLINGNFDLAGRGFSPATALLHSSGALHDCLLGRRKVQHLSWEGDYAAGRWRGTVNLASDLGRVDLAASIGDSLHAQNFSLNANCRGLRIPALSRGDSLPTVMNFDLAAQGRGLHPDTLQAQVQLAVGPSLIVGVPLDTLWGGGEVYRKHIKVDTLNLRSALGDFHLGGTLNRVSSWALRFKGRLRNPDVLRRAGLLAADTLAAHGKFEGEVSGFADSLRAHGNFALESFRWNTLAVDTLTGEMSLGRQVGHWRGRTHVHGENAQTASLTLDNRFDMRAGLLDSLVNLNVDFAQGDSLQGRLQANLALADSVTHVAITAFDFRFKNQEWGAQQDTMWLDLGHNFFQLRNLHLVSGEQSLRAEGVWDLDAELNFQCVLEQLEIQTWPELFHVEVPLSGRLNATARLQGTAQRPVLHGEAAVQKGQIDRLPYENLRALVDYAQERFSWHATFQQQKFNEITCDGFLPLNLSFANHGNVLQEDSMRIAMRMPGFDLSVLKSEFPDLQEAGGQLEGNLTIANTPGHPSVRGFLRLQEGQLAAPRYGVRFSGVRLDAALDEHRLTVRDLQFRRDKGEFKANGFVEYEQQGLQARLTKTELKLQAVNVLLASHRALELVVDGGVEVSGEVAQPRFSGAIKVLRARVDLPTFTRAYDEYESDAQTAAPMLVAAIAEQDTTRIEALAALPAKESSQFYQNLRGNLKVEIPRNTWLRSPALNVEISGELNVTKEGLDFEVFGPIQVLRGTYVLPGIGKSFEVESGTLNFIGGADYSTDLDLYAKYVFRDAGREKKTLRAHITGKSASPKFDFTLVEENNREVTETDALAYLIFGRSIVELTQGSGADNANGNGSKDNSGSAAGDAVTGMLSDRLSRRLGQELGVDVLQLRGDEGFKQMSFLVGKYLTNDLFVSYEDELQWGGSRDSNEPAFSTITVEYEVARILFLQFVKGDTKTTGLDAIIKIQR